VSMWVSGCHRWKQAATDMLQNIQSFNTVTELNIVPSEPENGRSTAKAPINWNYLLGMSQRTLNPRVQRIIKEPVHHFK
jgi:hypothetical protein